MLGSGILLPSLGNAEGAGQTSLRAFYRIDLTPRVLSQALKGVLCPVLLTASCESSVQLLFGELELLSKAPLVKLLEILPLFLPFNFTCILTFCTTHLSFAVAES